MKVAHLLPILACAAGAVVAASGFGARFGAWNYGTGFVMLRWGIYASFAIAVLAMMMLVAPKWRAGRVAGAAAALSLALLSGGIPWFWFQTARAVPPINDITTDTVNPPDFAAIVPLRAGEPVSATYPGDMFATAQRLAYPDIQPVELAVPPPSAFARALGAARQMGWVIVAADPIAGRIEATATTPWFGFKDDVVVRIMPEPAGSRIDVRSVSRVGKSDLGANAARIRAYVSLLSKGTG
jgi:hypothetical protein